MTEDTIVALASGAGRAGVAVIRVSGPSSKALLETMTEVPAPRPRTASVRRLYVPGSSTLLDEAVVILMPGPRSFTGEDVLELHVHGGGAVVESVLKAALTMADVRLAKPGEFSRRAFENQKMDLTRAEAIQDLVNAESDAQRALAMSQYEGALRQNVESILAELVSALASLEAAIDFPDESDIPTGVESRAGVIATRLRSTLQDWLSRLRANKAVRDGYRIAILGKPNAGKSTLFNLLCEREAAIVSDIPGTTRDIIEARLVMNGFVVILSDSAGLRDTDDVIEAEGVRRARARADESHFRILVADRSDPDLDASLVGQADLVVLNKADLPSALDLTVVESVRGARVIPATLSNASGLEDIRQILSERLVADLGSRESTFITNERHRSLVQAALNHLESSLESMSRGDGEELIAEDLRLAARSLGEIVGSVDVEHILDQIFGEFCIGK